MKRWQILASVVLGCLLSPCRADELPDAQLVTFLRKMIGQCHEMVLNNHFLGSLDGILPVPTGCDDCDRGERRLRFVVRSAPRGRRVTLLLSGLGPYERNRTYVLWLLKFALHGVDQTKDDWIGPCGGWLTLSLKAFAFGDSQEDFLLSGPELRWLLDSPNAAD